MTGPTPTALQPPRWGLADALVGLLVANLASILVTSFVLASTDYDAQAPTGPGAYFGRVVGQDVLEVARTEPGFPLWLIALLNVPLWIGYLGIPWYVSTRKGNGIVADFGLRFRAVDGPVGAVAGVVTQIIALPALYVPIFWILGDEYDVSEAARRLTDKAGEPLGVALLFAITVVGAPVIEEIFFRGLLFRSLDRRYGRAAAIWGSALIFAFVHWQVLQFPALALIGLVLAYLVHRFDRLGPAIIAHAAFNATTVVTLVFF